MLLPPLLGDKFGSARYRKFLEKETTFFLTRFKIVNGSQQTTVNPDIDVDLICHETIICVYGSCKVHQYGGRIPQTVIARKKDSF